MSGSLKPTSLIEGNCQTRWTLGFGFHGLWKPGRQKTNEYPPKGHQKEGRWAGIVLFAILTLLMEKTKNMYKYESYGSQSFNIF